MKKAVVTREPPKFIMAFMFLLFALMIWIATVQFLKNDSLYENSVRREEMLSYIVELYIQAIHGEKHSGQKIEPSMGKHIYLFQLDPEGNTTVGSLGVLKDTKESPNAQMIMIAQTKGQGYLTYDTHDGKRIAYVRWDPKSSHVVGGSMDY